MYRYERRERKLLARRRRMIEHGRAMMKIYAEAVAKRAREFQKRRAKRRN
ncbi:MAG: hypothetical protein AB1566_10160 [Chloroflexota bacterium]